MSEELGNDLIVIEPITALTVFGKEGGSESVIDSIRKQVAGLELDISTEKGRDQIKSVAYKIARTKTALDDQGKSLKSEMQKMVDLVDSERKKIRDACDALKEEVRKPLTDFENAEKERVRVREERISEMVLKASPLMPDATAEIIQAHLDQLKELEVFDWQEFSMRSAATAEQTRTVLEGLLSRRKKHDEDMAELDRLRAEQEELCRKQREEQIAHEAAEQARKQAEERAATEAKAAKEKAAAELRAEEQRREDERVAKERAEREVEEANARAEAVEAERKADAERAEKEKVEAIERAAREERERIEAERKKEAAATAAREADKKHKAKVNNEVLTAIMKAIEGTSGVEATAKAIVVAIASGKVPHTKINY